MASGIERERPDLSRSIRQQEILEPLVEWPDRAPKHQRDKLSFMDTHYCAYSANRGQSAQELRTNGQPEQTLMETKTRVSLYETCQTLPLVFFDSESFVLFSKWPFLDSSRRSRSVSWVVTPNNGARKTRE